MKLRPVDDDWNTPEADDTCLGCGGPMRDRGRWWQVVYCSPECQIEANKARRRAATADIRSTLLCDECGVPIKASRSDAKYCSRACARKAQNRAAYGVINCAHCGKEHVPTGPNVRFCSARCGSIGNRNKLGWRKAAG